MRLDGGWRVMMMGVMSAVGFMAVSRSRRPVGSAAAVRAVASLSGPSCAALSDQMTRVSTGCRFVVVLRCRGVEAEWGARGAECVNGAVGATFASSSVVCVMMRQSQTTSARFARARDTRNLDGGPLRSLSDSPPLEPNQAQQIARKSDPLAAGGLLP